MTSEEKLLNIIRKKKHYPKNEQEDVRKNKESVPKESESVQGGNNFNFDILKWSSRVLSAVSFLIFFYVVTQYLRGHGEEGLATRQARLRDGQAGLPAGKARLLDGQAGILLASLEIEEPDIPKISFLENKPFSVYQEKFQQRDIFQAPWDKPKESASQEDPSSSDLNKQLKLIGILLDKDSRAIVENIQTKETVFLSVGQDIEGATLEEIKEGKAIFRINDQRVELTQ